MKAVILTGGLGTRLQPLTFSIPKPLVPVGKKAILQLLLEGLAKSGVTDIILCTGYMSELIEAFCGDGSKFGVKCRFIHESKPLGTAGPLSLASSLIETNEDFLLINGDVVTTLDFSKMIGFHQQNHFGLTVGYTHFTYSSPFGVIDISGQTLSGIQEKPTIQFSISCGIYALNASVLGLVPDDSFFTMPDLMREMKSREKPVGVYYIREYWHGIENFSDLEKAASILETSKS